MFQLEKESQKQEDNSTSSNSENDFKELDNEIDKVVRGKTSFEEDKINDENDKKSNYFQKKAQNSFKFQGNKEGNINSDKNNNINNTYILKSLYQDQKEKLKNLNQKNLNISLNNNINISNNFINLNNISNSHNLNDYINIANHNDVQKSYNNAFHYNNEMDNNSQINYINKSIINTIYLNQLIYLYNLYNQNCNDCINNSNNNTFNVNNCIYNNNIFNNNVNNWNLNNNPLLLSNINFLNNYIHQENQENILDMNTKNNKDNLLFYLQNNLNNNYINNNINLNDVLNNLKMQLLINNNNNNDENEFLFLLNQIKNNEINNNMNLNNQSQLEVNNNNINNKISMNNEILLNNFNILSFLNNNNINNINQNIQNSTKNSNTKCKKKKNVQKSDLPSKNIINLLEIFFCKDKRTTLMIKNIPNKYTISSFLEEININFKYTYDIFYLPIDYVNKCNLGFAFINFVEPFHIILFYELYRGKKWKKFNSEKICELLYAKFQGKKELISHFEKGKVLTMVSEEKRPLILPTPNPLPKINLPYYYLNLFIKTYPNISYEIKECKKKNNNKGKNINNNSSISPLFSIKGNFLKN